MTTNRYDNALFIQGGACNPTAVAGSLHNACLEAMREGKDTKGVCEDAAVRLIAHQLAFLLNVSEINDSLTEYSKLTEECKLLCQKQVDQDIDTALEEGTRFERAFGDRYDG